MSKKVPLVLASVGINSELSNMLDRKQATLPHTTHQKHSRDTVPSAKLETYLQDTMGLWKQKEKEEKDDCDCVRCSNQFDAEGYSYCKCRVKRIFLNHEKLSSLFGTAVFGTGDVWEALDELELAPAPIWPSPLGSRIWLYGPKVLVKGLFESTLPGASRIRGAEEDILQLPFIYPVVRRGIRKYRVVVVRDDDDDGSSTCERCFGTSPTGVRFRYGDCRKQASKARNLQRDRDIDIAIYGFVRDRKCR